MLLLLCLNLGLYMILVLMLLMRGYSLKCTYSLPQFSIFVQHWQFCILIPILLSQFSLILLQHCCSYFAVILLHDTYLHAISDSFAILMKQTFNKTLLQMFANVYGSAVCKITIYIIDIVITVMDTAVIISCYFLLYLNNEKV